MSLIAELKRRKVFRVGAAYAVAAWAIAQVADLVLDNTAAPDWVMQVILLLLALGFPIALILAWAFELTPEGVKRTESASAAGSVGSLSAGDAVLIVLMLAVIGIAAYQMALMPRGAGPSANGTMPDAERSAAGTTTPSGSSPSEGATSIAVLAFENMSPDPDNAFFAEGISEEILNVLASIEDLRVASRTSAFSFAGTQTPIPRIAEQLNVVHVLEGSVRRAGNRVRITAQLIDAADDVHLWSDVYDRELDDIFAVQEEIAQAIAVALKDRLGVRNVRVSAPTEDLEAYQRFLRGRQTFYARGTTLDSAIADLQRAVELDPGFGAAWAVLAAAYYVAPGYPTEIEDDEAIELGRAALAQALEQVPDNALAVAVQGNFMAAEGDWVGAVETGQRAARLPTQDSTPKLWNAINLLSAGYIEQAHESALEAWKADPLVGINNGILAITALSVGDRTAVERHAEFAAQNGWPHALHLVAVDACAAGDREKAMAFAQRWLDRLGTPPEAFPRTRELIDTIGCPAPERADGIDSGNIGLRQLMLVGQTDAYFEWLRRGFNEQRAGQRPWLRGMWLPTTRRFREHPAFFELARRIGLVELWETRAYPDGCTRTSGENGPHLECTESTP